jgi:hypothetical protein
MERIASGAQLYYTEIAMAGADADGAERAEAAASNGDDA